MKCTARDVCEAFERTGELVIPYEAEATAHTQTTDGEVCTYFHFLDGSWLKTSLRRDGVQASWATMG